MAVRVLQGHVLDVLPALGAESVHVAVCSPPYFRLRRYGCPPQVWASPDGRLPCADVRHDWVVEETDDEGNPLAWHCDACGAWKGELGSEPLVELYVAHLVAVFAAVRRILRRDGTCWINLSGSYLTNPGGQNGGANNTLDYGAGRISEKAMAANKAAGRQDRTGALPRGYWLRPLNFVDTPGMLAHALQRDGWIWRADICLVKRSPLPESVQGWRHERCRVKAAEAGQPRRGEERQFKAANGKIDDHHHRDVPSFANPGQKTEWADCPGCAKCAAQGGYVLRRGNGRPTRAWERFMVFAREPGAFWDSQATREQVADSTLRDARIGTERPRDFAGAEERYGGSDARSRTKAGNAFGSTQGRNLRDWQFWPTTGGVGQEPHYAAYPIALPALAIRAGTPERGVCATCAAPWARVVERTPIEAERTDVAGKAARGVDRVGTGVDRELPPRTSPASQTLAWRPTCSCGAAVVPATVLDPFAGSGSSLIAADRLGRDAIGIDLNASYARMAVRRVTADAPLFAGAHLLEAAAGG